jgi:hypothetical protein
MPAPQPVAAPNLGSTAIAANAAAADDDEPAEPTDVMSQVKEALRKNSIPWSVSFALHLILIILLGIFSVAVPKGVRLTLQASMSDTPGEKNAADVRSVDISTVDPVVNADNRPLFTPTAAVPITIPVSPFGVGKVSVER